MEHGLGGSEPDAALTEWVAELSERAHVGAVMVGVTPVRGETEVLRDGRGDGIVTLRGEVCGEGRGKVAEIEEGPEVDAGTDDLEIDSPVGKALHRGEGGGEFVDDFVQKLLGELWGAQGEAEEGEALGGIGEGGVGEGVAHKLQSRGGGDEVRPRRHPEVALCRVQPQAQAESDHTEAIEDGPGVAQRPHETCVVHEGEG